MGKVKSIRTAFVKTVLACILAALFLSVSLSEACRWMQSKIYHRNWENSAAYAQLNGLLITFGEENEYELRMNYDTDYLGHLTPAERTAYDVLGIASGAVYPVCFILCIVAAGTFFYRRQLEKPLAVLDHAAVQIADNNLDFEIACDREDELGKLCVSFEKMRQALRESNEEMWRQMEERRRLNAAFAHDLRTPLTVLKGQSELLIRYGEKMPEEKRQETSRMLLRHIERMEDYVRSMGELQRLEDLEICRQSVALGELRDQLVSAGETLCREKNRPAEQKDDSEAKRRGESEGEREGGCEAGQRGESEAARERALGAEREVEFRCGLTGDESAVLHLDSAIVLRVFENLLVNALRFAGNEITAVLECREGSLYLTVADDGEGFSREDLSNATKPFYRAGGQAEGGHFGMGLNICKILCGKHGGTLELSNCGGARVTAVFGP